MTAPRKDGKRTDEKKPADEKKHLDDLLDEALEDTFPASDPPALTEPAPDESEAGKKD